MRGPVRYRRGPAEALDVSGRDRIAFLQGLTTNDLRTLAGAGALWSAALSPVGKVLFTFRARARDDHVRLLLSGGRTARAAAHFRKYAVFQDVRIDEPAPLVRFDLYGEAAAAPEFVEAWPAFFELGATWLVPAAEAEAVELRLSARGGSAITDEESEALRIEAGRPAEGKEIDETRTPDEAGLAEAVSATKGCYVGQEIVARMRTYGRAPRRLVRFVVDGDRPPEPGSRLVRPDEPEQEAGRITSSARAAHRVVALGFAARDIADGASLSFADEPGRSARVEPVRP